ncbi:hypothetical protein BH11PSE13_BH11PSE13_43590 [soil metagenome]
MGRPRKNPDQGLPNRLYLKSGRFYYVHPITEKWEGVGTDLAAAKRIALAYASGGIPTGSMEFWLRKFLVRCEQRVAAKTFAQRSLEDYTDNVADMAPFFGKMAPALIKSRHISEYLDDQLNDGRAVRGNREIACLSACIGWMVERDHAGLEVNVCKGVTRNPESSRTKYVSDEDFRKVHEHCSMVVRVWLQLIYITLQRPSDVLRWTWSQSIKVVDGVEVLQFRQSKTDVEITIALSQNMKDLFEAVRLDRASQKKAATSDYLICTEAGDPYTLSGIVSMASRYIKESGVDFAPYDSKAKGATDMFTSQSHTIEEISQLCGHKSITTTQIYIRKHIKKTMKANGKDLKLSSAPREKKAKKSNSFRKETTQVVAVQ